jgi:glycosyltransferase involved in cell wall biosynthesis
MRAAIYDKFWHSMGGGERHCGMIAQLLSQSGVDVDLVGHHDVSVSALAGRLALDLSKCNLRVVEDRGEDATSDLSAEYDLFVNATYMSRVVSRATRSAYLCFFPTPYDYDLGAARQAAIRLVGRRVHPQRAQRELRYGSGWYPPEGGRRRHWAWSNGDGAIGFASGGQLEFRADFGRPGSAEPAMVVIESDGDELARFTVTAPFTSRTVQLPPSDTPREIHIRSGTFRPGDADPRQLGVAMSRLRLVGTGRTIGTRLVDRYPWLLRDPRDVDFVESYDVVLANSAYTKGWIGELWRSPAEILFPPIEVSGMRPHRERDLTILSVGRFFAPGHGHSKRQLEMVRMFARLVRSGYLPGWKLVVIGGCEDVQLPYLRSVQAAAAGLPIEIHPNAPRELVEQHMASASIFWSATGLGENTRKRPWTNEHFGMTTAEAMVGGCVPVVIDRAGQQEIVRDGIDGFRWNSEAQWRIRTVQVATDSALRVRLADSAMRRALDFSDDAFAARWHELADAYQLMGS